MSEADGSGNVGLAFGMVTGAGLCTSLGAALAFVINLENKAFLAVSLALSCGVMVYVSMVEIFVKSLGALSDEFCGEDRAGETCARAYGATTGFFFLGLFITSLLNMLTSPKALKIVCGKLGFSVCQNAEEEITDKAGAPMCLDQSGAPMSPENGERDETYSRTNSETCLVEKPMEQPLPPGWELKLTLGTMKPYFYHAATKEFSWTFPGLQGDATCPCNMQTSRITSTDLESAVIAAPGVPTGAGIMIFGRGFGSYPAGGISMVTPMTSAPTIFHAAPMAAVPMMAAPTMSDASRNDAVLGSVMEDSEAGQGSVVAEGQPLKGLGKEEADNLTATGLLTGLAIAIHNFPEGLATFVGAMADPHLGAAIAVAIAIHNIPEGVCVAMPIYYSTGSRLKAFMWATLSGVSEPIGALFGYLILGGDVSNMAYGSMFGVVAGMMIYISLIELLPSAYRFASNPVIVTASLISGMAIMALSLVAFQI